MQITETRNSKITSTQIVVSVKKLVRINIAASDWMVWTTALRQKRTTSTVSQRRDHASSWNWTRSVHSYTLHTFVVYWQNEKLHNCLELIFTSRSHSDLQLGTTNVHRSSWHGRWWSRGTRNLPKDAAIIERCDCSHQWSGWGKFPFVIFKANMTIHKEKPNCISSNTARLDLGVMRRWKSSRYWESWTN